MSVYIENSKKLHKLLEITEEFSEVVRFKINKQSELSKWICYARDQTNVTSFLPES